MIYVCFSMLMIWRHVVEHENEMEQYGIASTGSNQTSKLVRRQAILFSGAFGATANNGSSNPEKGDSSKIDTEEKNVGTVSGLKGNALAESGALGSKRKEGDAYDRENGSKGFRKRGRDQNSERNREDGHRYERGQDSNFRSGKHKRRKMQSGYRKVVCLLDYVMKENIIIFLFSQESAMRVPA